MAPAIRLSLTRCDDLALNLNTLTVAIARSLALPVIKSRHLVIARAIAVLSTPSPSETRTCASDVKHQELG